MTKKYKELFDNFFNYLNKYNLKNKYLIAIFLILVLAIFLRFYNFENRWGIGNDDSRDIAIAREALARGELPLIGSFSSAGPFVFGPLYYWTVMTSFYIFPLYLYTPLIVTALSGVITVGVIIYCGYLIGGRKLALISGLLIATSPQLVSKAIALGQQSYIPLFTSIVLLFYILFWYKKKIIFAFLLGIFSGIAVSFHYQAINIVIFIPALLFVPKLSIMKRISIMLLSIIGFLIPSLPLLIWDSRQNFSNLNNVMDYMLVAQYRLYVPNSWKLFVFNHLPTYWAMVMGKEYIIALVIMFFTILSLATYTIKRNISGIMFFLSIIFYILLIINKFYKGERSEGYLLYFVPFLILFSGWAISNLISLNIKSIRQKFTNILGVLFLISIIIGNMFALKVILSSIGQISEINRVIQILEEKYPNSSFSIYDYTGHSSYQSQALSLILKINNKTDPKGVPIGVTCSSYLCVQNFPRITKISGEYLVFLNNKKEKDLRNENWIKVNQENMYDDLIGWSKRNELKSTFSLQKFIIEKIQNLF